MSDRPRRRPVPTITPASFDDERPTPVTSTKTTTDPLRAPLAPEPPTIPAISITAPSFQEAAKAGPPKPKREREGDSRTVAERVGTPPAAALAQPPLRRMVGDQETRTEIAGLTAEPSGPAPAAAPPQAPKRGRPEPQARPTEAADPWEYKGEVAEQAASLGSDYEGGGVELDASGQLVAPGMKRRARKNEESDPGVAPADLLSVALEMWPDAPPPKPSAPLPRVEPVAPAAPPGAGSPQRELPRRALPPEPPTEPPQRELPRRAASEAPTSPPRRSAPRAPGPMRSPIATADTVLRAPRGSDLEDDEAGVEPTRVKGMSGEPAQDELIQDEPRYGEAGYEEPAGDDPPAEDERYDEAAEDERLDEASYDEPAEETRVKGGTLDEPTSRRNRRLLLREQQRRSRWPGALLRLLLLGLAVAGVWLWYTGQWSGLLADLRLR